jgi:flagellar hook-associated protein 1 FlgK
VSINFSAFEIGRRALRANQLGLTVAGHNISNVNTPGYTRQAVQLSASAPDGSSLGLVGTGVTIDGVRSFRDRFLESRIQSETAISGRLTAQRDALAPVDAAFNETANGGLSAAMQNFFGAFRDLEASPGSVPLRSIVIEKGNALANSFHTTRARLDQIRRETDNSVRATVDQVNTLAQRVAQLNTQIQSAESSGNGEASELRDQRGELVKQLADLTGARSIENTDGTVTLTLGDGRALVVADKAAALTATSAPPDGLASITIGGQPAVISEGRLKGFLDAVGFTGSKITDLDQMAASIVSRVNALHTSGTDLDGNAGQNFFADPVSGQPVTAANITVDAAVVATPRLVVASPLAQPASAGTVAGAIANLLSDANSVVGSQTGSYASIYGSIVADAGEKVRSADDALSLQAAVLAQATAQRDSLSGVSLDEEAINMLRYQRAFEAAAKFLKVADEMTQTILALGQ